MSSSKALTERLQFIQLGSKARSDLASVKAVLMRGLPDALDQFYAQIRNTPETRKFFNGESHIAAAKSRQIEHWDRISSAAFDERYLQAVTAVGEVHAKINLEPRWYIGGYALVLEGLIGKLVAARWPKGGFGAKGGSAEQVTAELSALTKATLLDMDLAIAVYLEAIERDRQAAEAKRTMMEQEQAAVVAALAECLHKLAGGDLTTRVDQDFKGDYAQLKTDFNRAVECLTEAMGSIAGSTNLVRGGAEEIASAADDLSRRTEQQAASLEETAAALDEITVTVKRTAEGAKLVADAAATAKSEAARSGDVVRDAVAAMAEIERSSGQISRIIGVIDEIAFQTNLLALNAGVEAARAGDAGRGFAVVAQEVRALAQRSADAAKEIKQLIAGSTSQVAKGVKLVGETGQALNGIVGQVSQIDDLIAGIAASSQEQASGLHQVNAAVNQMDQVTQQNAAMVEQTTAAAAGLKQEAIGLTGMVSRFRTGEALAAPVTRPVVSPPKPGPTVDLTRAARIAPRESPVRQIQDRVATFAKAPLKRAVGDSAKADDGWEEF